MPARRAPLLVSAGAVVIALLAAAAWMLFDRGSDAPNGVALHIAAPTIATPPPTPIPAEPPATPTPPPDPAPTAAPTVTLPAARAAADCEPVSPPIAPVRISDADPAMWTPPPLPDDTVCGLIGGTPWQAPEDLHSGAGADLAEFRARPFLFGATADAPPSNTAMEDLASLAAAYERWLAAWPAAARSWSILPYAELASSTALAERDRSFARISGEWGDAQPLCSPFNRSDAWLGARIDGDAAFTYSWRRGEAARCTDATTGRDLSAGADCVGPLYAVATRWNRNPAGDPPWLVVSETHRDPLSGDRASQFASALAGAPWDGILTLHRTYGSRIASEESQSNYTACAPRPIPEPAASSYPVSTVRPQWTPAAPGARFWIGSPELPGSTAIVIIAGDRVPYDGERVPASDPAPEDVREGPMDIGDGTFVTHCRTLANGRVTCWARTGWLVADEGAQDAPWLGVSFAETEGSSWDYCRSVGGEDTVCWNQGFLPPAGSLPGRPGRLPPDLIPVGLTDPLAPGRAFCRPAPGGGQLCWIAYAVPDGGIWRPVVPVNARHSSGRLDPTAACRFGADGIGRDRAFCAPTAEQAALIAADPDQQPIYERPGGALCVRHATGEACWTPRPDITHHRPATWYLP